MNYFYYFFVKIIFNYIRNFNYKILYFFFFLVNIKIYTFIDHIIRSTKQFWTRDPIQFQRAQSNSGRPFTAPYSIDRTQLADPQILQQSNKRQESCALYCISNVYGPRIIVGREAYAIAWRLLCPARFSDSRADCYAVG